MIHPSVTFSNGLTGRAGHEGHCLSFGRSIAFHPLIDLLKHAFRLEDGDTDETIVDKVEKTVTSLGEDLRDILPYVRHLLSVEPGDPSVLALRSRARRAGVFDGLRRLALRAAQSRPHVLVIEDLQWIDKASEEFLLSFIDCIPAGRIVLIATYRTDYDQPFGERTYYTRIALDVMSTADSVRHETVYTPFGSWSGSETPNERGSLGAT